MTASGGEEDDGRTIVTGLVPKAQQVPQVRRPTPASPRAASVQAPPSIGQGTHHSIALAGSGPVTELSNPLLATALPFLSLLSRVRMGELEVSSDDLREAARSYIKKTEGAGSDGHLPANLVQLSKVCLAAMADDVCQTNPGFDADTYRPLAKELFGTPSGSKSFFSYLKTATDNPDEYAPLLELMLVCLGLGYEGRYRYEPRGAARVAEKRAAAAAALASVRGEDRKLSHRWQPVVVPDPLRRRIAPLWMIAGVGAAMVIALFASLASVLNAEAQAVQQNLQVVHQLPPR